MPNKKSDEPKPSDEERALQERIDRMMATDDKDSTPAVAMTVDDATAAPAVADKKTAPPLPSRSNKKSEVMADTEKPIVIKLTDENKAEDTTSDIEDTATDKAVDDIVASESDKLLAVDDALAARKQMQANQGDRGWKDKLKGLLKNKRTWIIVAVILVAVLGLPQTRYKILSLVVKKPVTITVLDSKNGTPVSNAEVQLGGASVKTDPNGKARLKAAVGKHALTIKKKYYQNYSTQYFVGLKSGANPSSVKFVATGRLVPITVRNKITGKSLSGALISVLGTTAKTNSKGEALVALPTTSSSDKAKLSLNGYNAVTIDVEVTDKPVKNNSFELTPAGRIYFLSNLGGKIDVVKANLDGTGRKIVLEGTGQEDANTTNLLASRDWRYLVLKARRDSAQPALYLLDTNSDKVTQFDSGDANFNLIGWYGHAFIYDLTRNSLSNWQASRQILKSYDAEHLQLNQLDQNQAEGSSVSYGYQSFYNFYILSGVVAYNTQWNTYGYGFDLNGKTNTIRAVQLTGQGKKDYQSFPAGSSGYAQASLYEPEGIYYAIYNNKDSKTTFYKYEDQSVKPAEIDSGTFNKPYPTFLISPSGKQTFWTEQRDGKNTLFIGDANAEVKKQIASLSDYTPYGWYGDSYTLVSKNSSQLFIMPAGPLLSGKQPLKITDYYKPTQTYNGYGYGYGGL